MSHADVRVGIVSWNTGTELDRCLAAVPAALPGVRAEVVVVDNASTDDSVDVAKAHDGVRVIVNDRNVGYARAMNQALADTDAPALVALNPDTEPEPGSLAALVADLDRRPAVGLVVPRLVGADGGLQHSVHRFPSVASAAVVCFVPPRWQRGRVGQRWWLEGAAPHDRSAPVDWAIGAVHVIRTAALAGHRPYLERWFMYAEDIELCWRLHRDGWGVWFDADVSVPHIGNVAGAKAWGRERERRHWAAAYDCYGLMRGRAAARRWAAVNTVGAASHLVANVLGSFTSPSRRAARRTTARQLADVVPVHARAAVAGPPPIDTSPPG